MGFFRKFSYFGNENECFSTVSAELSNYKTFFKKYEVQLRRRSMV